MNASGKTTVDIVTSEREDSAAQVVIRRDVDSRWQSVLRFLNRPVVRLVIFCAIIAVITLIVRGNMDFVSQSIDYVRKANPWWFAAAVIAIALSMVGMGELMYVLLRSAGVRCNRKDVYALTLTSNSVSATFPGGPAISMAMVFREQHSWGASSAIASWYAVVSGVIASGVLAAYGLGAFYILGAQINPWTLVSSLALLFVILFALHWIAHHLDIVERLVLKVLAWYNGRVGKKRDRGAKATKDSLDTLRSVDLPPSRILLAAACSAVNWGGDCVCLLFCLWSVGVHPHLSTVILAFVTAKIVGTAQVTPGGLGPVEATIVGTLVATGLTSASALAATIIFRFISFFLLAAVGWVVFLVQYAGPKRAAVLQGD